MIKWFGFVVLFALAMGRLTAAPLIVAAENFYGNVAKQVGGPSARVMSIISNPNQDPHEFQIDAGTAKAIADADIVIYNGLGYDDWVEKLLRVKGKKTRRLVIKVSDLSGARPGDNPHIWYNPQTMLLLAEKIAQALGQSGAATTFQHSMQPLFQKIAMLRGRSVGVKVTATEPVFGYMASMLGFEMLNIDYQLAVMNGTDPSFQQTVHFENSLKSRAAKILFYNSQVSDPVTKRMLSIAKAYQVPVIGVTETQPPDGRGYVDWMLFELEKVQKVLE